MGDFFPPWKDYVYRFGDSASGWEMRSNGLPEVAVAGNSRVTWSADARLYRHCGFAEGLVTRRRRPRSPPIDSSDRLGIFVS